MSVRVNLPPGCAGLDPMDRSRPPYMASPGGTVTISDEHARALDAMPGNGTAGLVTARHREFLGTRKGRWCLSCQPPRLWNAWTTECHRCGCATTEPQ